jgi:GPH family glycoside/pentoside/hexuronide:cation symporter
LASALPLLLTFVGTRERPEYQSQEQPKLRESIRAAVKNRPFVFGLAIFLLTWVAVMLLESNLLFLIKYVIQREAQSDLFMLTIFAVAIAALPLWQWISRHLNKRWAYTVGIAFWAVVQIVIVSLNHETPLPVIFVLCGLAGIGVSAAHVLPWAMIPDAIEWDELETGKRHEGMFYSLVTLVQKVATSVALPLGLLLLGAMGYVPNAAQQPASAVTGIRILAGPIPAALLCLGIVFALFYPLSRERHAALRRDLDARRAQLDEERP